MPEKKCEYCGMEYSEKNLSKCPSCGAPLKTVLSAKHIMIIVCAVLIAISAATAAFFTFIPSDASSVSGNADPYLSALKKELKNAVARAQWAKAVKLCEEHSSEIEGNEYFEDELDEIINHFSASAKNFYKAAAVYTVHQYVAGNDVNTGFEGYDPKTGTIDAKVLKEHLSAEDYVAAGRTTITCGSDKHGQPEDFIVTIDICGRTVTYPTDEPLI